MTSVMKEVTTGTWNYMSPEAIQNTNSSGKGFKVSVVPQVSNCCTGYLGSEKEVKLRIEV